MRERAPKRGRAGRSGISCPSDAGADCSRLDRSPLAGTEGAWRAPRLGAGAAGVAASGPGTHPFPVQQQVGPEDGGVADGHLLVPVGDLEDAAVHGALVDAGRVQAAVLCKTGGRGALNPRTQTPARSVSVRPEGSNAQTPFSFLRVALVRPRNRSVKEAERWPLTSHNGRAVPGGEGRECGNCASRPRSRLPESRRWSQDTSTQLASWASLGTGTAEPPGSPRARFPGADGRESTCRTWSLGVSRKRAA